MTIDLMIYFDISAFSGSKHAHIFFSRLMHSILSDCNLDIQLCLSPYLLHYSNFIKHQNDIFTDLKKAIRTLIPALDGAGEVSLWHRLASLLP